MNAEIICIGTELLLGDIVNTNAQYLSRKLAQKGINVFYQSSIGDNRARIVKSLSAAITRSNLIIITGGLGPTADDITLKTVSDALGIPLEKNQEAYNNIVEYFKKNDKPMTQNNEKQAYLPKGCTVFENKKGTAPGCAIESGTQCIIFLPGPPAEMQAMFEDKVSKYLNKYSSGIIESKFVKIYGVGESEIDQKAADLINGTDPTVAPYAKFGEAELRVTANGKTKADAQAKINATVLKIKSLFGESVYGYDDDDLQTVVVRLLKEKGLKVSTAESCTAGYISKRITDISGSSEVFNMGVVTYSNESKTNELSVPPELIEKYGAVSKEVAACMAKGVRQKSGADIGLSITGIAGPASDGTNKPIGLSFIGLSLKEGEFVIKSQKGANNDREYIRYTSASEALNFLRLYLEMGANNLQAEKINTVLLSEIEQSKNENNSSVSKTLKMSGVLPTFSEKDVTDLQPNDEDESIVSEKIKLGDLAEKNENTQNSENTCDSKIEIKQGEFSKDEELMFQKLDEELFNYEQKQKKSAKKHSFLYNLFIHKGDKAKDVFRKIIFWIAFAAFIYAGYTIGYYYINPLIEQSKIEQVAKDYRKKSSTDYYSSEINPKFKTLYNKNKDVIGWITIDGTNIDYPVMQSKKEQFYLRKGFDKSYSREGMIFASKKSSIKFKKESKNIMLYGHHMKSTGTMFKQLDRYLNISFYKKNPTIVFDSLYRDSEYKIFAVMITNALREQDNGNIYNYRKTSFSSKEEFAEWIKEARVRSLYETDIDIKYSDEILTLQTCNDSFGTTEDEDKARLIIMARRVRQGEKTTVDKSEAVTNPQPKMPQAWYDAKNMTNPFTGTDETETTTETKKKKSNTEISVNSSSVSTSKTSS